MDNGVDSLGVVLTLQQELCHGCFVELSVNIGVGTDKLRGSRLMTGEVRMRRLAAASQSYTTMPYCAVRRLQT